jgi:hypothetical protein
MIVVFFLLGALVLLVTLLLFGFVGCAQLAGISDGVTDNADYPTTIKSTAGLEAYWRLGEPAGTPVPSSGGTAKSAVGGFHGDYDLMPAAVTPDGPTHSPVTAGLITLGVKPGLLQLASLSPCINTDGGFVRVPFAVRLNPPQFTFEAWVAPDPNMPKGFFHCLAESGGPTGVDQKKTGWGLYLGPDNENNTPPDDHSWQVWMGNGTAFKRVAIAKGTGGAPPTKLRLTYLVLTFDGKNLQLWLYYPDTNQNLDVKHLRAAQNPDVTVTLGGPFKLNDTSADGKGDFFIGTGRTLFGPSNKLLYPFKGSIQEVALYKKDLAGPAPDFAGLTTTLGPHESVGGNF